MIEESPMLDHIEAEDTREQVDMITPLPEISFHAITGMKHPQTLRVVGKLKNNALTVLIDGGSTHNFIDQAIVRKLEFPIMRDQKLQVMVANQDKINCERRCLGITLIIHDLPIQAIFYILLVTTFQEVLGVQWLATLGPVETNYDKVTMSFQQGGKTCMF
ncbi:hypothetical protein Acr_00g0076330 [Actinidia rufa]|uniref:Uncharacterized protein n=1 Tax=Actinidia rufa TaxID=165716 RepID=A0A7J0DVC4_9ERIC|nr:hypothetical protein Acr_00g0076330 [Actinidia rufa]